MGNSRLVLIDGEHYLPVIKWAISRIGRVCGAVFLGGGEKTDDLRGMERELGVKVYRSDDFIDALSLALRENSVSEVIDLSDEPVVSYEDRFRIASTCLKAGVEYVGADFRFTPRPLKKPQKPSIGVIGTGKRVGKTAVAGFVARTLKEISRPVVVTMGRGGPEEPEVIEGEEFEITPEFLLRLVELGKHAASDHLEDALTSRVTTIGCRRCGGGMAGFPFLDAVDEGVRMAEGLPHDIILLEGSGATFPPYLADGYVAVTSALQDPRVVGGYFGPFRLSFADVAVITMADLTDVTRLGEFERAVRAANPWADVHKVAFRPRPLSEVSGRRIGLVLTSKHAVPPAKERLESLGAEVVAASGNLSNRGLLRRDLGKFRGIDAVAVELKAAAVDVVTRWALGEGIEVIYLDNEPVNVDGKDLRGAILDLGRSVLGGGG